MGLIGPQINAARMVVAPEDVLSLSTCHPSPLNLIVK